MVVEDVVAVVVAVIVIGIEIGTEIETGIVIGTEIGIGIETGTETGIVIVSHVPSTAMIEDVVVLLEVIAEKRNFVTVSAPMALVPPAGLVA